MSEEERKKVIIVGTPTQVFGLARGSTERFAALDARAIDLSQKLADDNAKIVQGPPSRQQRRHKQFQDGCKRMHGLGDTRKKRRELARNHKKKVNR